MTIIEYFNPYDPNHLAAYEHLQNTGTWSSEFYQRILKKNIEFSSGWQIVLIDRMARIFIQQQKQIHGF